MAKQMKRFKDFFAFATILILAPPVVLSDFLLKKLGRNGLIARDPDLGGPEFNFGRYSFQRKGKS